MLMKLKPQLCLGTAQFGLRYGITNMAGQVPEREVAQLLFEIEKAGFRWLDTAQAYGNAEEVLGRYLPESYRSLIISKLPAQPQAVFKSQDVIVWEDMFHLSCEHLGVASLYAFLLHAPSDLNKPGGKLLEDWLFGLRQRGLVKRLGVSIYSAEDLEGVNPDLLDMVQLPLSLFDQRLLQDGTLARLRAHGTAIHARSLYLQGLLLTPAAQWPAWVSPEVRAHQQALESLAVQRGCRLIDLALGFAQDQLDLEGVVLGLSSVQELRELQLAWSAISPWKDCEWRLWALKDPSILDPRRWPQ
jgi:aryl-alcohol dehydrogenase-like predicted oxidoreductase